MRNAILSVLAFVSFAASAQYSEMRPDTLNSSVVGIGVKDPLKPFHLKGGAILGELSPTDNVIIGGTSSNTSKFTVINSAYSNGVYIDAPNTPGGYALKVRGTAKIENDTKIDGDLHVSGTLSKSAGSFRIDHPLDPENMYLYHSFVESPDMLNIYSGNVITNNKGLAVVTLPEYFEALNIDFRYQLTIVGKKARGWIYEKVSANQFTIKTNKPKVEVSWQVSGSRNDDYAKKHPIKAEVYK
ncbi:MAG: hypothetical protein NXI00_06840 [Cytophagales bacterium]|nr:hypothetical protein [Cytophagales bacterium]